MILNNPTFRRLVWKEYRAQRAFWLVVAICCVVLQIWIWAYGGAQNYRATWAIAVVFTGMFAIGCGAILFAGEKEDGTADLLRAFGVTSPPLFSGKYFFSIAAVCALLALLSVIPSLMAAAVTHIGPWDVSEREVNELLFGLIIVLLLMNWGAFFSLTCRSVLKAVVLGVIATLTTASLVNSALLSFTVTRSPFDDVPRMNAFIWAGASSSLVLLIVSYLFTRRMVSGRTFAWAVPQTRVKTGTNYLAAWGAVVERRSVEWRTFRSLVWQEWQQARGWLFTYLGAGLVAIVATRLKGEDPHGDQIVLSGWAWTFWTLAYLILSAAPVLAGVWAFRGEQESRRFRFLSERGLPSKTVWLSKHCVWLPGVIVVTAILVTVASLTASKASHYAWFTAPTGTAMFGPQNDVQAVSYGLYILLGYAAGQFASMLLSRVVVASFLAVVLTGVLTGWGQFMEVIDVPVWWSVAPLVLVLFAATRYWSPTWMIEGYTLRTLSRLALFLLKPAVALWIVLGVYRVCEIPRTAIPDQEARHSRDGYSPTSHYYYEIDKAVRIHMAAVTEVNRTKQLMPAAAPVGLAGVGERPAAPPVPEPVSDDQGIPLPELEADVASALLEPISDEDREALDLALSKMLQATDSVFCDLWQNSMTSGWFSKFPKYAWRFMAGLLWKSARQLELEGKLDDAFVRYLSALRFARHIGYLSPVEDWSASLYVEKTTCEALIRWADHKQQTPQRVRDAIQRLQQEFALYPDLTGNVLIEYGHFRERFARWPDLPPNSGEPRPTWETRFTAATLGVLFPWESKRAYRVLDVVTAEQLQTIVDLEMRLAKPACNMLAWDGWEAGDIRKWDRVPWFWQMTLENATRRTLAFIPEYRQVFFLRINQETTRRGTLLLMALVAQRRVREKLPEKLQELVDTYFDALPLDPWNGQEFGYRPTGFTRLGDELDWGLRPMRKHVAEKHPVLWSTGAGGLYFKDEKPGHGSPSKVLEASLGPSGGWPSDFYGLFFPIPPQTNTPP